MTRALLTGVVGVCGAVLGGCGDATPGAAPPGGSGPVTPAALAWIVDQHVPGEAASAEPSEQREALGPRAVGTDVRFRPAEAEDGELVRLAVAPAGGPGQRDFREELTCAPDADDCFVTDGVTVLWETAAPEEDPGAVLVLRSTSEVSVLVLYAGPEISGDPRDLDLSVPVEALVDLASDPRVAMTTSAEALVEGAHFEAYDDPATPGRDIADPDLTQPATPATLALLAEDHFAWSFEAARPDPEASPGLGVELDFPAQSGWRAVTLRASARTAADPGDAGLRALLDCDAADGCEPAAVADGCDWEGEALVAWQRARGADPGEIRAATWRAGELVTTTWSGDRVGRDPRGRDAQVPVGEVVCLLRDPRLGALTTQDLADESADMPSWWQG